MSRPSEVREYFTISSYYSKAVVCNQDRNIFANDQARFRICTAIQSFEQVAQKTT